MVVMLKQCCCGCSLKTGTLIISIVFIVLSGLQLMGFTAMAVSSVMDERYLRKLLEDKRHENDTARDFTSTVPTVAPTEVATLSSLPITTADHGGDDDYDDDSGLVKALQFVQACLYIAIVRVVLCCFEIGLHIVLIFGANKDSPRLVLVWLMAFTICSGVYALLYLGLMSLFFYSGFGAPGFLLLTMLFILPGVVSYSLLVVYSYYRHLKSNPAARRISQDQDED